jgi:hypothetical protein
VRHRPLVGVLVADSCARYRLRVVVVAVTLAGDRFESAEGSTIGRKKGARYYRLGDASPGAGDAGDALREGPETEDASPSPPRERARGGDASSGRDASVDEDEIERLAVLAREAQSEAHS